MGGGGCEEGGETVQAKCVVVCLLQLAYILVHFQHYQARNLSTNVRLQMTRNVQLMGIDYP